MNAAPVDDSKEKRLRELFTCIQPAPFGALFTVSESVWRAETVNNRVKYDQQSDRKSHPGCSIQRSDATLGSIPLLLGTSARSRTREVVPVKGVYGEPRTTWFGSLDPVPVSMSRWQETDTNLGEGGRKRRCVRPACKARLAPLESEAMKRLCDKMGW
jgi:hypothetical protein